MAHSILVISYHILFDRKPYKELGAAYLERREKDHASRLYVKQTDWDKKSFLNRWLSDDFNSLIPIL